MWLLFLSTTASWAGASATVLEESWAPGSQAAGQAGDVLLANDRVGFVITDPSHPVRLSTGGHPVDAAWVESPYDVLAEVGTWLERDWPRQARYLSLEVGPEGERASVTVQGVDSGDADIAIRTTYSLGSDETWLTLETTVTNHTGATLEDYDLGDALVWGDCEAWVPGVGAPSDPTTSTWLGCTSTTTSLAYAGSQGQSMDAVHGKGWSDAAPAAVSLEPGASHTFTRWLSLGGLDVASAADPLVQRQAESWGELSTQVFLPDGWPASGAQVEVADDQGLPFTLLESDAAGRARAVLPAGTWTLSASGWGVLPDTRQVVVEAEATPRERFDLAADPEAPPAGDSLSLVQRPLPNLPSILTPGDPLQIEVLGTATVWEAALVDADTRLTLSVEAVEGGLVATVPQVPWWGLYDLEVTADGQVDHVARAVHVVEQLPTTFTFAHITDTHLPTHTFSYADDWGTDQDEVDDLLAVLDDLALIHPAFVLVTGDVVNEGEVEDYRLGRAFSIALDTLGQSGLPTYVVAGNHDLGGWPSTYPPAGTSWATWWRFFGWSHRATQDYSFDLGGVHFVGLQSWVDYDGWAAANLGEQSFTHDQLAWLQDDLAASEADATVLFFHMDFRDQLELESLGVDMALWGHIHKSQGSVGQAPYDLATAAVCDGARAYRLVDVIEGELRPRAPLTAGEDGRVLRTVVLPDDSGTHDQVEVRVINGHDQAFEGGRVWVRVPPDREWEITGATLVQSRRQREVEELELALDIPAVSTAVVELSVQEDDETDPPDTGSPSEPGCGCHSGAGGSWWLLGVGLLGLRRRRGSPPSSCGA